MNEKFFSLPLERQHGMMDAAIHVFAQCAYKRASMEAIAARAGVSKALLFHYFGSKKELHQFVYAYATKLVIRQMSELHDYEETDFFRILIDAQMAKIRILGQHPDLMNFLTKAYFEENAQVRPYLNDNFAAIVADSSRRFLARADSSRLKDEITARQALNIVLWMADGFMRSRTPQQLEDLGTVNAEFLQHVEILRRQFYKEEFQ